MILESGQAVFRGKLNDKRCGRAAGGAMARSELFRRLHVPEHQEECQVIDRLESAADEQRPGEDTGGQEKPAYVLIQKFLSTLSLDGDGTAAKSFDGRQDILGGLGPADGLGVCIAGVDIGGDCRLARGCRCSGPRPRTISASRFDAGEGTHDRAKVEEARKAVKAAFEGFMQAGQEHYRLYFEDRLREIDGQLAVQ